MKRNDRANYQRGTGAAIWICLAISITGQAAAKEIGTYKDWSAHMLVENKARICYMHGVPIKSTGKYKKRGDTYIQVTHRTREKTRNEISVTAGYTYRKASEVTLTIDGKKYVLFTHADTAWAGEENPDDKLVAAMRAGSKMVVKGFSGRGTETTDNYSLSGFTAAHNAISKACRIK